MAGDFDLHQLLAGPIIAMNDAQADASASFYELFEQFAFEPVGEEARGAEPPARRLRMISFVAERATLEGIERRRISMPLLQMIPIGGVAIDSARIQFSLAINAEPPASARSAAAAPDAAAAPKRTIALKGRIAPASGGEAMTGNLQVDIMLKQVDLPAGYMDMIAETQGGISERVSGVPNEGPAEDMPPLFTASIREPRNLRLGAGNETKLVLEIVPNEKLIGPDGLDLTVEGEPGDEVRIAQPRGPVRLGAERRTIGVVVSTAQEVVSRQAALLLAGTSVSPDGVRRSSRARLEIPWERTRS